MTETYNWTFIQFHIRDFYPWINDETLNQTIKLHIDFIGKRVEINIEENPT